MYPTQKILFETKSDEAIKWYSNLDLNQKINVKDCFELLCGVGFSDCNFILNYGERITILYNKLKAEGFI